MSTRAVAYDLTIIDSDGSALFGTFSGGAVSESDFQTPHDSLSHDREYLKIPDNFTSAEIDFLEGGSSIGAVTVPVLDKRQTSTDQTSGLLTSKIDDVVGLRAILRRYKPGSATWTVLMDGVIHDYSVDRGRVVVYNLHLRDGRDFERGGELFESNFVLWGKEGETGPLIDYGRNRRLEAVFGSSAKPLIEAVEPFDSIDNAGIDHFERFDTFPVDFDGTSVYGGFASVGKVLVTTASGAAGVRAAKTLSLPDLGEPTVEASDGIPRYKKVRIRWRAKDSGDAWTVLRDFPALSRTPHNVLYDPFFVSQNVTQIGTIVPVIWFGSFTESDIPTDGQEIEFQVIANPITDSTPFFWDGGTLGDLLQEIVDGDHSDDPPDEQYDSTELTNFAANSPYARMIVRSPVTDRRKWVEEHIYKPDLRAPAFDAEYEIFPASWVFPSDTSGIPILDADTVEVVGDWNHGISNAIRKVEFTYIRESLQDESVYRRENDVDDDREVFPWDRLIEEEVTVEGSASDAVTGAKVLTYEPVTIRALGTLFDQTEDGKDIARLVAERAIETVLPRFKKGAPTYVVRVHATSDNLDLRPGDWVRLPLRALPNYADGTRPDDTGVRGYFQIYGISDPTVEERELKLVSARVLDPTGDEDLTDPNGTDCFVTGDGTLVAAPSGASLRFFESDGDLVNNCGSDITVRLLAIAGGGGGGGGSTDNVGGGGGAGGVLDVAEVTIAAGETIPVRIGSGGASNADGEDTVLWVDPNDGTALDPATDPAPSETTAVGGGSGAASGSGSGGGSGGGGAGALGVVSGTSNTSGGGSTSGQGNDGGSGEGWAGSTSQQEQAAGGGGGSFAEAGGSGDTSAGGGTFGAGEGGSQTTLADWGLVAGGGGGGGAWRVDTGGTTVEDSAGASGSGFGAGGGGDKADGTGASAGAAGILAVIYAGAAQTLTAPDVTSTTVTDRAVKICVEEADWATVEPAGYQVRVEYAVTDSGASEPSEDANDWTLAGVLTDPGCVWTDQVPIGSKVWHRVRAEADNFPPSDWGTVGSDTLAQTPDLLAWNLDIDDDTGTGTVTWTENSFTDGIRLRGKRHDADGDTSRDLPLIDDIVAADQSYEITSITVSKGQYLTVDLEAWQTIIPGYDTEVIDDGPLQYLRLGDSSGTTAEDSSGNDTDGTYINGPTLGATGGLTDDPDTAVTFDGSTEYIGLTTLGTLGQDTSRSFEFWINSTETGQKAICGTWNAAPNTLFIIRSNTDEDLNAADTETVVAMRDDDDDWRREAFATDLYDGAWHHVVIAQDDNSTWRIYVDGSLQSTQVFTDGTYGGNLSSWTNELVFGAENQDGTVANHIAATFDEIAVYDFALTATQVQEHYDAGTAASHPDPEVSGTEGETRRASHQREESDEDDDDSLDNRLVLDNNLERVLDNDLNPVLDGPP